eukprot:TRINITY_DN936_c0_g1_i1.p1 TRINITY_DN936_c0_g1~~TRINITY_DN936_c0_g1_i1.p1  ORF type:complete len:424 (+),score=73.27 TRINITY_DN936_c0_g1_i1:157-1428(+)
MSLRWRHRPSSSRPSSDITPSFLSQKYAVNRIGTSSIYAIIDRTSKPVIVVLLSVGIHSLYNYIEAASTTLPSGEVVVSMAAVAYLTRFFLCIFNLALILVLQKLYYFLKGNVDAVLALESSASDRDLVAFTPPESDLVEKFVGAHKLFFTPDLNGIENIPLDTVVVDPERPLVGAQRHRLLFVCNHSLMGIEMPMFIWTIFKNTNVFVRGLSDHAHFEMPGWASLLSYFGAVNGTRENCSLLMRNDLPVLVYPGGGHEVMKKKSDAKYGLMWKERKGFARLAIQHGYTLVPCCCVGSEDMLEIVKDIPLEFARKGLSMPLVKPIAPSKLQKLYFWFGEPIPTAHMNGDTSVENQTKIRDVTKVAVEGGIQSMLEKQEKDPSRYLHARVNSQISKAVETLKADFVASVQSIYTGTGQEEEESA